MINLAANESGKKQNIVQENLTFSQMLCRKLSLSGESESPSGSHRTKKTHEQVSVQGKSRTNPEPDKQPTSPAIFAILNGGIRNPHWIYPLKSWEKK